MFPIDFNSSIEIAAGEPLRAKGCQDRFLANLARELTKRKARSVSVQGHRLEFTGTSFFVSNLNMLAPISGGSVEIRADEGSVFIQYRLSFEFLFWITLAGAGLIGIPALSTSGTDGLLFLLLIWLWLFFGNFTLTIFRFSRLLGRLAGSARH